MRNGAVSEIASASRHPYIPMDTCTYCDAPTDDLVTADDVDGVFCCSGCLEAHRVAEEQTETTTTPAATTAMDTTTITERTRGDRNGLPPRPRHALHQLRGLHRDDRRVDGSTVSLRPSPKGSPFDDVEPVSGTGVALAELNAWMREGRERESTSSETE
jgi:hypothetical protein